MTKAVSRTCTLALVSAPFLQKENKGFLWYKTHVFMHKSERILKKEKRQTVFFFKTAI
jgi:hypothetical protein